MEYSINKSGTDLWLTDINYDPDSAPPTASAATGPEWETIWFTEDEQEADNNCPPGFVVGPRPPRPH